jgi:GTPase KRas protein
MSEYRCVIIGGGAVGKSSLTIQFIQGYFVDDYDPTIEDSYRKQITVDEEICIINILDTAGQEEYTAMRDQYLRTGEGFVLVYSITSCESFEEIKKYYDRLERIKDVESIPLVIAGNKCDLNDERQVTAEMSQTLAQLWNVPLFETSALTRFNVENIFSAIVREMRKQRSKNDPLPKRKSSKLSLQNKDCVLI